MFDFRIWDNFNQCYFNDDIFISKKQEKISVGNFNIENSNNDRFKLELWCGICDKEENKIYVGDIILLEKSKIKKIFEVTNITIYGTDIIFMHHKYDKKLDIIMQMPYEFSSILDKYKILSSPVEDFVYKGKNGGMYKNFKKIGNIHENIELLTKKSNL
ncbi:YopX family protein [Campylobacter insulaenigrae]|uniref:YopX family protein n=1 Tax=Campylobacter insulaenigrae TaxID=260714 RepID=UPI0021521656|nr:YopX family protein [Campylobacter insulaenigrae]MCR6580349.1 YopX family protein [Campylobacter insulaenigrae]